MPLDNCWVVLLSRNGLSVGKTSAENVSTSCRQDYHYSFNNNPMEWPPQFKAHG